MDQPENERETIVYSQSQTRHYANPEESQQVWWPNIGPVPFFSCWWILYFFLFSCCCCLAVSPLIQPTHLFEQLDSNTRHSSIYNRTCVHHYYFCYPQSLDMDIVENGIHKIYIKVKNILIKNKLGRRWTSGDGNGRARRIVTDFLDKLKCFGCCIVHKRLSECSSTVVNIFQNTQQQQKCSDRLILPYTFSSSS